MARWPRTILKCCLALSIGIAVACSLPTARAAEISDNFTDPGLTNWIRYEPLAALGVHGSYAVDQGVLTMSHPPSPNPRIAPAHCGLIWSNVNWTTFRASVDFSGWSVGPTQQLGLVFLGRCHLGANGLANGLDLGVNPTEFPEAPPGFAKQAGLHFEPIFQGTSTGSLATAAGMAPLDPSKWYRILFVGGRSGVVGALYEVGQTNPLPIVEHLYRTDYSSLYAGTFGFVILDGAGFTGVGNNAIQIKLANFTATGTAVPVVTNPVVTMERAVILSWPAATAGWILEGSNHADGPWTKVSATSQVFGDVNRVTVPSAAASQFYRLRKP